MASPSQEPENLEKGEDKDSLFSTEEEEEQVVEVESVVDSKDLIPVPEYTEDDLQKLCDHVISIVTIYNLNPDDWQEDHFKAIKEWFTNVTLPVLTVFYEDSDLQVHHGLPDKPCEMFYLVREPLQIFKLENFFDTIFFGTIAEDVPRVILDVIAHYFSPHFFVANNWPDSIKNEFTARLIKFLCIFTDIHYKLNGLTVLFVPYILKDISVEEFVGNNELIKKIEGIVVYWTKQVRLGLQDQDQNTPHELLCPRDEYEFWEYRHENLWGLKHQMEDAAVEHICEMLTIVSSTYIGQFTTLRDDITRNISEAKSNIEYLSILMEPCEELSNLPPNEIPEKLPYIFNLIRFIWMNSPYYNSQEKITLLCRSLSNQLILTLTKYVKLDVVFKERQTRKAINMFQTCIDCISEYNDIYQLVSESHKTYGNGDWDLDKPSIFNHVDAFLQRCKDMIEICQAMIVYGRLDELEDIPAPLFGGVRGEEFESWASNVLKMFFEYLEEIEKVQHKILDVKLADWYDDILKFRSNLKDIDVIIENLINEVFEEVANVEEGIESLAALNNFTKRRTLRTILENKTSHIYKMFQKEILECKRDIEEKNEEYPSLMPYYAGRATLMNLRKNRLSYLRKLFENAGWLLPCSIAHEIFNQYDKLVSSIDKKIGVIFRQWVESIGEDFSSRLNRSLMCKSTTKAGLIECNIDRSLLEIFKESRYWELLNFEIPTYLKQIYKKASVITFVYESVLDVVLNYNKILSSLSDQERKLFKPLISVLEKKILPGLHRLTWANEIVDEYIAECSQATADLQQFLDDYKACNLEIVSICEKICDSLLINIIPSYSYDLDELVDSLSSFMNDAIDQLLKYYQQIIKYLIVVFEGFELYIPTMAKQWIKYINNFDTLVEEALKICCKKSLEMMYCALHGDGTTEPHPLIKLKTQLIQNRITFSPTLGEIANVISNILNTIIEALSNLPRLNDKFHVADVDFVPYSTIIEEDSDCNKLQRELNLEVAENVKKLKLFISKWEPYRDLWEVDKELFVLKYEKMHPTAATFDANIARYTELANNVQIEESVCSVHFLQVDSQEIKNAIIEHCIQWQLSLCKLLFKMTCENIDQVYNYTEANSALILKVPETLEDMQVALSVFDQLKNEIPEEEQKFPQIVDQVLILDKYRVPIPDEVRLRQIRIPSEWATYLESINQAEKMLSYSKEQFKVGLLEEAEVSRMKAKELYEDFMSRAPTSSGVNAKECLKYFAEVRSQLQAIIENESRIQADLRIFGLSFPESADIGRLDKELSTLEVVWDLVDQWDSAWDKYKTASFWEIETGEMEETAQTLFRKLTRLSRELAERNWTIVEDTRKLVDSFRRTLPLIGDLKNPAMRARHWDRVRAAVDQEFDETASTFNLELINSMELHKFTEEINEISNAATMELQIENGLKAISDIWEVMKIEIVPYKDKGIYRIKNVDDCFATLEEHMVQLGTMKSTRFVEPFAKEVDFWERSLSYIMETIEMALLVQRQWLYLENIFYGEDIRKQLPVESDDFNTITEQWRFITARLYFAKSAFKATHMKPPPYVLNKLNQMYESLDFLQRALERYLETKRQIFPRFYFISNDDLLEILGNSRKPDAVQPHFKKLFDNLNKIKLQKSIVQNRLEAAGMFADDGEYVAFLKPVILDGPVEMWLVAIEQAMRAILKSEFKPCRGSLKKMLNKRDKWLLSNCGQLCNASSLIQWTTDCTRALVHSKIMESKKPLKRLRKKQNQVLGKLSELSRKDLTKLQRLKTNALVTIEIHSRDVIDRLYRANCRDTNSFEWFSQLRFYWDRDTDDCIIKQTNTLFQYGYEYNGNSGRLVITPLTDRCYITLTTALHLFRGGSPKGPAGTGKTETVKDLGKAMGMWVIVNNCSEGLDYKSMGKCFSGLAQTGAWGCFDEFNRINIEVLSVVAQQILCILSAISQKLTNFVFEGIKINLKLSCGIFITMNPGYAGRTELPDNLKSMFRPISMMVPDSAIIAENILFSDGFQNTKLLAKKVFTLYQLAVQQLSKQDHYDFGLRSMVALLRYGGRKRRLLSQLPEEQVVYLAMRDMNVARLTADDLPLFNGIMSDIFPGVSIPLVDYTDMTEAITNYMVDCGLQPIPIAITKVFQLYETKSSRHSVMILGKAGAAKSSTWDTLRGSMGILKKNSVAGFNNVYVYPINPKALSQAELYGEYNLSTGEWLDGVISSTMRTTCADESVDEKWILFDGPVDAVWIENMNSVMDDNKVLTLINSDRITMPEQVSLLFEVADLSVASPATVSRCGMVYNDYRDWGWLPFVTSWVQKYETKGKYFTDTIMGFFKYYTQQILDFKRLNCEETVACGELNVVMSLCKLLEIFLTKEHGVNPSKEDTFEDMAKLWFLFCMIWSICCTTTEEGRKKMDSFIRDKEGVFPIKDTVYEYVVDPANQCFAPWEDKLPYDWKYDVESPFFKIIVPTVDTIRYEFLVRSLLDQGSAVLLTGPVGTGKTSTAQSVLMTLDEKKFTVLNINMSAQTSSNNLQETVESRLEKRTKENFAPVSGKTMITFLDDMNMPAKETYGSQPPLELLRQWIDYGFWYDRTKQTRKYIQSMHVLGSMGPPGGGRNVISERLLGKFNVINMTFPDDMTISRIFGLMLSQQLSDFDEEVKVVGRVITETTIELYDKVITKMLPTPAKIHYLFNLRDISKVFQGLLRCHKDYQNSKPALLKLWIHECFRVFSDRLIDHLDREWFITQMNSQLGSHFELTLHSLCPKNIIPIYTDIVNPFFIYEEVELGALRKFLDIQMEEYNNSPGVIRMDLVLFRDAIEHICRIIRVISQPRGNMLLIGIGGSGRQSLSRIAAYICEYNTFQISVTRNYKGPEFREDLKILYSLTGVEAKPTSFLFNDVQVTDESFLETLNNMLSSGEVSNLYKPDEFEDVKNRLDKAITKAGITRTNEAVYNLLIERARANTHVILCMSPIGEAFRNRLRQYPALVNSTTIDWFLDWPKEALLEVANKYIADVTFLQTITGEPLQYTRDSDLDPEGTLREAVAQTFATIHDSVALCSKRMALEMKRYNYVTPTNYLELVARYKINLAEKREYTAEQANRLRNGLFKIDDCRNKVATMSVELEEAQVKVAEFQQQCDDYLVIIVAQRKEADEQQREVAQSSIKIREEEVKCQHLANLAQADLDEAMPALNAAIEALDALSKKDISEMKSYTTPPPKVKMVMEAVNILKGLEPNWAESKRLLGDMNFLKDLKEFDRNHIGDKTLKKISGYTSDKEFEPEKVGMVSFAAKSLCLWVIAIEKYAHVWKIVEPKQAKLNEATESLRQKQILMAEAQAKLAELNAKLQTLQKEYEEKLEQKEELNRKAEMLKIKLERANTLVECLSGERQRWSETVETLDTIFDALPGNCMLATAFVSYLGPFVSNYREELLKIWRNEIIVLNIPFSEDFDICSFLSDATTIREWNIQGLPADTFSTENGIIVTRGSRWPLLIDPQCQGQKWIKAMEAQNNLHVIDFAIPNFMRIVERAVQFGKPILVNNILETIDPSLNPILGKAVVKQGGQNLIKLDDKFVTYHDSFRIFFTTKMNNPHYAPEIATKATLVNFAVKEQGLEAQLLGIVVRKERPQLEEQKDTLVTTIAKGKRMLIDLEKELLRLLAEARGSILEDTELFYTLQTSKSTAEAVSQSLEISETTEIEIDAAREGYRPCAQRASILFFVLNDMGQIDPMYQFALDAYIYLFIKSINKSPKAQILENRISLLNEYHTFSVYTNTCRALFEHHKLLFSFHMCIKILEAQGKIVANEYNFLLKGGVVLDRTNQMDNPCIGWLNEDGWDNITELDKLQGFHGVVDTFEQYPRDWCAWYIHTEPETLPLIGDWQTTCNEFQKMLFVRSLRQDRVSFCITNFIIKQLGPQFVEPPVLDIKAVLEESVPQTPLIFVLSPGVDPTTGLSQLAEISDMADKFHSLSLGQGQAPIATRMIQAGIKEGHWVFLANCHLSLSWMPKLDKLVDNLQTGKVHPSFRLWLSSSPHPEFPLSILQAGIKMTTEPPKGLKANLKRLYQLMTEDQFNKCEALEKYKKLLFALCFFHAVLLERKKFQQLGWNVIYSFNDADFEVSENLLGIYLDEYPVTPWDALKYLIAGVNYGGHVTDDWDRRLLLTYINQYFCEDALTVPFYRLSSLSTYYIPRDGSLQTYHDYITLLPTIDRPEAFGQHPNADITSLISETRMMCATLMSLQIQAATGVASSKEERVAELAGDVLVKLPKTIDYENVEKLIGPNKTPLQVVLLQEIQRFNTLLNSISSSLDDLQKGIKGLVVMSTELDEIFTCIYEGRVPPNWLNAYPSLKLLGSWTRDLIARVAHFAVWAETLRPPLFFWLSAYTFPTGFLTAVLQTAARATEVPIDSLSWEFTVMTVGEAQIVAAPEAGVYVKGMFLEGAGWDKKKSCLVEPQPMQLVCPMPLIHFKPVEQLKKKMKGLYSCPCYYYPIRCGTGSRPSYVVAVDLKSGLESSDFWVKRGTALLLSLAT